MTYTLQAIVAKGGDLKRGSIQDAKIVPLKQNIEMLPFTNVFIKTHKIDFLPLTDEGVENLPKNLMQLCAELSNNKKLAYIEAEFFGGEGTQACVVFLNGKIEKGPLVSESAINVALANLGVAKQGALDEFEAVGLNEQRDTENWVK